MNKLYRKSRFWLWTLAALVTFSACTIAGNIFAQRAPSNPPSPVSPSQERSLAQISATDPAVRESNSQDLLAQQPSSAAVRVWVAPSLERVSRTSPPGSSTRIQLDAAKGEYESFQVIIQAPPNGLKNVNITVSDLRGPNQQLIPKQNITLYREHYVNVRQPSWIGKGTNRGLGAGWYADGLIPFIDPATQKPPTQGELKAVPFALNGKQNQPIWVDIFVPRQSKPGQYQGTFTVTTDRGKTQGKILLNVWNFELPLKPSLKSSFDFWTDKSKSASIELLKHKLMPKQVDPDRQRELIDKWGLNSVNLGHYSAADVKNCKMNPPPAVEKIRETISQYSPSLLRYNYTADEIDKCPNFHNTIKQWGRNLHAAGASNLITMKPTSQLLNDRGSRSAVDIWVVLPKMYDEAKTNVLQAIRKGNQVWSYNALVQDDYSPKWEIDFKPINFRIQPGFISQSLNLTGLLYWQIDLWTKDPWNDIQTYDSKDSNPKYYYPGEGMLMYPGAQVGIEGVVPSMRLKWLRDGVEDYEYVQILKGLGRKDWALKVARQSGQDWHKWTQDERILASTRHQLGQEIHKLKSK
jgi:Domain of unknown function (DUF4091)